MKKFAIYLPQFHEIPENDEWWGKGFTEWTNVKKAVPLYEGHIQPKVPYNNNYYCLDNPSVLQWQNEIASSHGIEGMIFYHYYFTGKLLLEKPAEILLKNKNIPMKFFFLLGKP
ncbi:MAG: glycoside hydrolase family 99-like domain-containing protein [Lachnospiraceae bacterium]